MSSIGLLNKISTSTYTNVSATDDLTVGSSLRNLGTLTQIGPATFSGTLTGLLTAVANGADLTYTYDASSKTFTIQINNASISNSKLANSSITLNGLSMSLGTSYTIPLLSITNGMLEGSITNAKLSNSAITLNGVPMSLGTSNLIPNTTITPTMLSNGTAQNQVLLTGISPFAPTYKPIRRIIVPIDHNLE